MRRVAFIDHTAVLGGAEIALVSLVQEIDQGKWRPIVVLGRGGPLAELLRNAEVPADIVRLSDRLGEVHQGQIHGSTLFNPRLIASAVSYVVRLAIRLRRRGVEVIHANSLKSCVLA